jgi:hypothetical protein
LLVIEMVAVFAPVLPGLNATVNVWLAPAFTLNGVAGEVTLKSVVLLLVRALTVRTAVPVFEMVTVCVADVVPTFWLPNARVVGDTLSTGAAVLHAGSF